MPRIRAARKLGPMLAAVLAMLLAPAPAQDDAIVGGWVVHAHTGARLPGVRVSLHCGSRTHHTDWTDIEGAFVFRDLPAGTCFLIASFGTHIPRVKLTLRAGERRLIDIPLDPESKTGEYWQIKRLMARTEPFVTRVHVEVPPASAVILGGLVLHARTRAPVSGALLVLRCFGTTREQPSQADGTFVFRDAMPGQCTLQVLAGTENHTSALVLAAGERRLVDLVVDPERKLTIDPATAEQMRHQGDTVQLPARRP